MQDKSELSHAIEVFGAKTVAGALDKNPAVKKKSCEEIKKIVGEYSPYGEYGIKFKPPKMLKASTQITARLIRDKVWAVFCEGINLTTMIYDHLIINHAVPREKLGESSLQIYQELLARCCDSNERVQEKAEDTLEAMITNEKIRNAGNMHEALLQPFQAGKGHPKMALCRTDLAFYMLDQMPDIVGSMPCTKASKLATFGLSAVNQASAPVRKAGERFMIKLFEISPKAVRKAMPPDNPHTRKSNLNYKYMYDEFIRIEKTRETESDEE